MNCELCRDELDEYVLGQSDSTVAAAVAAHLQSCSECRSEAAEIEAAWAALPAELPQAETRDRLRQRVMGALDEPTRPAGRAELVRRLADANATAPASDTVVPPSAATARERRWSYALAAGVLIALTVGNWWVASSHRDESARQAAAEQRAAAKLAERLGRLMRAEGIAPTRQFQLSPVGGQTGAVRAAWDQVTGQWHVFALDLPPAPKDSRYYLWLVGSAGEAWGFEFADAGANVLAVNATPPVSPQKMQRALITLESIPAGNAPQGQPLWESLVDGESTR